MTIYRKDPSVNSGLPLGGIGAGKLELTPQGLFNAFTFLNNWHDPIAAGGAFPGLLGYHLGFFAEDPGRKRSRKAFLLQTAALGRIPVIPEILYEGAFPETRLRYRIPGLGLEVTLRAWCAWSPGDIDASSMPCVFFELTARNRRRGPVDAAFLFTGRNLSGEWCVGRSNRVDSEAGKAVLLFTQTDRRCRDPRRGTLEWAFDADGWTLTSHESWNAVTQNFHFSPETFRFEAWEPFSETGQLGNARAEEPVALGENREFCGAVAAKRRIAPGQAQTLRFTAAWYYPDHAFGHRYARRFKSARAVTRRAHAGWRRFSERASGIVRAVRSLPFPAWFNDALSANLSPFVASTWLTSEDRFAFYEAPKICPLMGTLDVGFYGSIPLAYFFPKQSQAQLLQFAAAQRADGYVPHDLGRNRLDLASNGTTFYHWKDLAPKFIVMAYRDALWSGDRSFLLRIYPHAKRAAEWTFASDRDQDGFPDHEGADHTFDLWNFRGAHPYTAGIFLTALAALERMADEAGDRETQAMCAERFREGRRNFERKFWRGRYFGETSCLFQLNGQWMADLLGLPAIADPVKIRKALTEALRLHGRVSAYGLVNSVTADGRADESNPHSKNIWLGINFAFVSQCILRGLPLNVLLKELRPLWDNVVNRQKRPWDLPDMIDARTGEYLFGDSYYRNLVIWSIPIAYAKRNPKTARILRWLRTPRAGA